MAGEYLEHHGIKGQKWGVRRYQNEDGSLTDAGRERYLKGMNSREKVEYLKSDESTRAEAEKYMDQGLTYTEANEQVIRDRQERNRKIAIAGAAAIGTILAAYGGYKLYKHLGSEAMKTREFYKQVGENAANAVDKNKSTLYRHWENSDLEKYKDTFRRQGEENARNVTRGSVLRDKLGISTKADRNRQWQQTYERQDIERAASRRADLNRQIDVQRQTIAGLEAKKADISRKADPSKYKAIGREYDAAKAAQRYKEADAARRASTDRQIEMGHRVLEELLKQRKAMF